MYGVTPASLVPKCHQLLSMSAAIAFIQNMWESSQFWTENALHAVPVYSLFPLLSGGVLQEQYYLTSR